jgi:hypothetical protein
MTGRAAILSSERDEKAVFVNAIGGALACVRPSCPLKRTKARK